MLLRVPFEVLPFLLDVFGALRVVLQLLISPL